MQNIFAVRVCSLFLRRFSRRTKFRPRATRILMYLRHKLFEHRNSHGSRRPPNSRASLYIPCICRHHAAGKTYIPLKFVKRNRNLFFHKRDNGIWRLAAALRRHINGIYKNAHILIPIFRIQSHIGVTSPSRGSTS